MSQLFPKSLPNFISDNLTSKIPNLFNSDNFLDSVARLQSFPSVLIRLTKSSTMFNFPIFSVVIAVILAYVPHVAKVIVLKSIGKYDNRNPRKFNADSSSVPDGKRELATRLLSCHNNQLETLGVYAAAVAINVAVTSADNPPDYFLILTSLYVIFRAIYVVAYASPQIAGGYLRSLAFGGCIASLVTLLIYPATAN